MPYIQKGITVKTFSKHFKRLVYTSICRASPKGKDYFVNVHKEFGYTMSFLELFSISFDFRLVLALLCTRVTIT